MKPLEKLTKKETLPPPTHPLKKFTNEIILAQIQITHKHTLF